MKDQIFDSKYQFKDKPFNNKANFIDKFSKGLYESLTAQQQEKYQQINQFCCKILLYFYLQTEKMKKANNEKLVQAKNNKKEFKKISFELSKNVLEPFVSKKSDTSGGIISKTLEQKGWDPRQKEESNVKKPRILSSRNKTISLWESNLSCFNHQVLLMQYGKEEVYVDSIKTEGNKRSKTPSPDHNENSNDEFIGSCVRVITEETNCTLTPISARNSYASQMNISPTYEDYGYFQQQVPMESTYKNKRAVSYEESRNFVIDVDKVQQDGRLTVMVRNIPIKYTQDMLMELFSQDEKIQKFDFFYLPIDSKNNCNVGYAFLNFLHPKFIKDFYFKFHGKKWEKFNSKKIIQVCYARIQGTAQLAYHFEHSKVIQKEKKVRPIGLNESDYAHLSSLVQKQKTKI